VVAGHVVKVRPVELYQVFEILKPLPLVQVRKEQADLTEIF